MELIFEKHGESLFVFKTLIEIFENKNVYNYYL